MKIDSDGCVGLIVCHPTGVKYESQTGGMACNHPEVEGAWVPGFAFNERTPHMEKVHDLLCWGGDREWTEEELKRIEAAVSAECHYIQLDRERLGILEEAWIPIVFVGPADSWGAFGKLVGLKGIFTYNNCD